MLSVPQRYGQTDGRTDGRLTIAIPRQHYVHRAVNKGSPECTAKIWVVAQTPPVNRSLPNFACGFVSRMFLNFEFQKDRVKMWEMWGVEISPLPLTRHIAYTTACGYRTSRDSLTDNLLQADTILVALLCTYNLIWRQTGKNVTYIFFTQNLFFFKPTSFVLRVYSALLLLLLVLLHQSFNQGCDRLGY